MDEQLEHRWKTGKPPFDGRCIRLSDHVPLPTCRLLLRTMLGVLHERKGHCTLYRFDDWHEHDGYQTESRTTNWEALNQVLMNDQALHHSRHRDSYVRWAYYPDDFTFLLRYDVLDPDEEPELTGPEGDCDLCADANIIEEVRFKAERLTDCLEETSAKAYFDQTYAG